MLSETLPARIATIQAHIKQMESQNEANFEKIHVMREAEQELLQDLIVSTGLAKGPWKFKRFHGKNVIFIATDDLFPELTKLAGGDGIHHTFWLKRQGAVGRAASEAEFYFDDGVITLSIPKESLTDWLCILGPLKINMNSLRAEIARAMKERADLEKIEAYLERSIKMAANRIKLGVIKKTARKRAKKGGKECRRKKTPRSTKKSRGSRKKSTR